MLAYGENMETFKTELCITVSKFHFFPSLAQMNFSMHEKCKEVGEKKKKIGENKLFCLLQ